MKTTECCRARSACVAFRCHHRRLAFVPPTVVALPRASAQIFGCLENGAVLITSRLPRRTGTANASLAPDLARRRRYFGAGVCGGGPCGWRPSLRERWVLPGGLMSCVPSVAMPGLFMEIDQNCVPSRRQ